MTPSTSASRLRRSPAFSRAVMAAAGLALTVPAACDSNERSGAQPTTGPTSTAAAAASAALEAAKKAAAEKANRKVIRRPKDAAELLLTPERRTKIESANPKAQGFLDQATLEQQLFQKALNRGNNEAAVAAFDRLAKGRYVLFTGNIMAPESDRFQLAVRYTPREATDPMGLTATWFPVHFRNVTGYDHGQYRAGQPAAVLARYDGKQQTSNGVDIILLEQWDFGAAPGVTP